MFSKMLVTISNERQQTFLLEYQIHSTPAAQIWANCIKQASLFGLREKNRFYNFPKQEKQNLDSLIKQLEYLIANLQKKYSDIYFPEVNKRDLKSSINELHYNFAHSALVTQIITSDNREEWDQFNVLLHAIEGALINERSLNYTDIPAARIIFTWNEPQRTQLIKDSFSDFVTDLTFGSAYINYSQIGRSFCEMFYANDDLLDDEHIKPFQYMNADTYLYFGPTIGHAYSKKINKDIGNWFEARKERFNRLGYFWGNPNLAIGHLPVARLTQQFYSVSEINDFINSLSQYDQVEKVSVE